MSETEYLPKTKIKLSRICNYDKKYKNYAAAKTAQNIKNHSNLNEKKKKKTNYSQKETCCCTNTQKDE